LVTGGSGRLGRTVVADLAASGCEVIAADRVAPTSVGAEHTVTVDLLLPGAVAELVARIAPQAIVHLAAIPVPFVRPDDETYRVNTSLAFAVGEAAIAHDVGSVIMASSPTVLGYGDPGWQPAYLPFDETHPVAPWHAYAVSKVATEELVAWFSRRRSGCRFAAIRPCYVITPEEWDGAPTQAGHTVRERLEDPALAAISLFNYCDARDIASFCRRLITVNLQGGSSTEQAAAAADGQTFFVGAADGLASEPLAELLPTFHPTTTGLVDALTGTTPAFSIDRARSILGWEPRYSWRTELA
jgi:nucleoside-diphosphate-sugar epimerase